MTGMRPASERRLVSSYISTHFDPNHVNDPNSNIEKFPPRLLKTYPEFAVSKFNLDENAIVIKNSYVKIGEASLRNLSPADQRTTDEVIEWMKTHVKTMETLHYIGW